MQAALIEHDRVRRSTELPLFYGRKEKDSITPRLLIDRHTKAAEIGNWDNDDRKINEFYMILRDRALIWWSSLADADVDTGNWEAVKTNFLASYEPRYTAKTTCANFGELLMKTGESNLDYYLRVCDTFSKLSEARPAAMLNVRANAAAQQAAVKLEGIRDAEKFFKHQLYLAGLRDDLRTKVMEAGKATLQESVTLANELETIYFEKKAGRVNAVAVADAEEQAVENEDFDEEEIEAINAIRQRYGRPAFRGGNRRPKGNFGSKKPVVCRYCKKTGHMQKSAGLEFRPTEKWSMLQENRLNERSTRPLEKRRTTRKTSLEPSLSFPPRSVL